MRKLIGTLILLTLCNAVTIAQVNNGSYVGFESDLAMGVDDVNLTGAPLTDHIHYVNKDATGANDGSSWADAHISLQDALSFAALYDEVWVAAGTYTPGNNRNHHFLLKNTVAVFGGFVGNETDPDQRYDFGPGGSNETILSGDIGVPGDNSDNSYHIFYHPEALILGSSAILDGFTIAHGNSTGAADDNGAGMANISCTPTIRNCAFVDNTSGGLGGGLYFNAPPISTPPSDFLVEDCLFSGNTAYSGGGASISTDILVEIEVVFSHCVFEGNQGYSSGGHGGGLALVDQNNPSTLPVTLDACLFENNTALHGGGLYNKAQLLATNCVFRGNEATYYGGGIANSSSMHSPKGIVNCTIVDNHAANSGGGIHGSGYWLTVKNTIIWGNTAGSSPQIQANGSIVKMTHCNIQNSFIDGVWDLDGEDLGGNIDADPLFVSEPENLHLTLGSPCLSTGSLIADAPATDLEGNLRPLPTDDTRVDMGAYELGGFPRTIYVDASATGAADGTNWGDAYPDLVLALESGAAVGEEVWVASGTYTPGNDRNDHFRLWNHVSLIGGFAGNETDPDQRYDFRPGGAHETILSGDIGTPGANTDNTHHLFYHAAFLGLDSTATLDGFTIAHGNSTGAADDNGAGMVNISCTPTIRNCAFVDNTSGGQGGGLYFHAPSGSTPPSDFLVEDCLFSGNTAYSGGGASISADIAVEIEMFFSHCVFEGNQGSSSGGHGGGLVLVDQNNPTILPVTLDGCLFENNTSLQGGGLYNKAQLLATNCVFRGNEATYFGGGIANVSSMHSPKGIVNCTIVDNHATNSGGGVHGHGFWLTVKNTIIWGNTADSSPQIQANGSIVKMTHCNIQDSFIDGVWDLDGEDLGGNIDADPLFVSFPGNLRLAVGSPSLSTGSLIADAPATDMEGNIRPMPAGDTRVDMGAYESEGVDVVSEVELPEDIARSYALNDCYPNPFNPQTTIAFELPTVGKARLRIYDLAGRVVRDLVNETLPAGRHEAVWTGRDNGGRSVASGTYFVRLVAGEFEASRTMTLVK
jgi:hypothetical protein